METLRYLKLLIFIILVVSCHTALEKNGLIYEYYPNGNIQKKYYYKDGEEIYYKTYNSDSSLKGSRIKINVRPNKYPFYLNDTIFFSIKPEYTEGNALTAYFGELNKDGFLKSEFEFAIVSDSLNLIHKKVLKQKGKQILSGILLESYSKGDTIFNGSCKYFPDAGSYYFSYEYDVKE